MPPYAEITYVVQPRGSVWTITMQGRQFGRYKSRRAALRTAILNARRVHESGKAISVLVRRMAGPARVVPERMLAKGSRR